MKKLPDARQQPSRLKGTPVGVAATGGQCDLSGQPRRTGRLVAHRAVPSANVAAYLAAFPRPPHRRR
jgi:hypothetical protein